MCVECKDTNPLSCSIVALWHFYLICVIHLWIILSVIILIKQFDCHQFKYIILGHFPCGYHFFFKASVTQGTILSGISHSDRLCTEKQYQYSKNQILKYTWEPNKCSPLLIHGIKYSSHANVNI